MAGGPIGSIRFSGPRFPRILFVVAVAPAPSGKLVVLAVVLLALEAVLAVAAGAASGFQRKLVVFEYFVVAVVVGGSFVRIGIAHRWVLAGVGKDSAAEFEDIVAVAGSFCSKIAYAFVDGEEAEPTERHSETY